MKTCFKCNLDKELSEYYVHPGAKDGHLNKCKECTKQDTSKRTIPRVCETCKSDFKTWPTEIKRGGGITCSRKCYFKRLKKLMDEKHPVKDTYSSIHKWVYGQAGKAISCSLCDGTSGSTRFEWSNKSGLYKQDMTDWWQLCVKCHRKYDEVGNKESTRVRAKQVFSAN